MIRHSIHRRAIGALAIVAMIAFHAASAWATACEDPCADMGCCPAPDGDAPPNDELRQASCCDVPPLEAMRSLSERTPATVDGPIDQLDGATASLDVIDVQPPAVVVETPRTFPRAHAPPSTRTTVLLL